MLVLHCIRQATVLSVQCLAKIQLKIQYGSEQIDMFHEQN